MRPADDTMVLPVVLVALQPAAWLRPASGELRKRFRPVSLSS